MSTTLNDATARVQRQLDDEDGEVWTRDQIKVFIQDGYDSLCRDSECLYDILMFDSQPAIGNYTRDFERDFMTDMPIFGRFNFTREFERAYVDEGARGPMSITKQSDAAYLTGAGEAPSAKTVGYLPDRFVSVERVTHDWYRLLPESARYLRKSRNIYQTEQGGVFSYSMDQDGLFAFRTVGVPVTTLQTTTHTISGTFGVIRAFTATDGGQDLDPASETYILNDNGFGIIRQVPQHFVSSSQQYGASRQIIPDAGNTRVEYFRLGKKLTDQELFEIPDRFVKYVEWWALYRAFSTPGEGEDQTMSAHYRARYEMGKDRITERVNSQMDERAYGMGTMRLGKLDSYLERFPSDHGYSRPFRR